MHLDELIDCEPMLQKLLSGMPADIKDKCCVKRFREGSIVVKKADSPKCVHILVRGELRVVNEFENGNIYVFASITPLDFIGELEVLAEQDEYAVTIEAVTDCATVQICSDNFSRWIKCDNTALLTISRCLAKKMYPTSFQNGNILLQSVIHKVQAYIARYSAPKIKDTDALLIAKKRQQIADELGNSVKSINRSIKKLNEEGLITIKKGKIYISKSQYLKLMDTIGACV